MIQNSVNQLLGQLGVAGGYLSHIKSNMMGVEMQGKVNEAKDTAKNLASYGQVDEANKALEAAKKDITPTGAKKWFTPPQALMESKRLGKDLDLYKTQNANETGYPAMAKLGKKTSTMYFSFDKSKEIQILVSREGAYLGKSPTLKILVIALEPVNLAHALPPMYSLYFSGYTV